MIKRADLVPCTTAILLFITVTALAVPVLGQDLPDYWKGLVGTQATPPEVTATSNLLALNTNMFELYDSAGQTFTKNILANQPVILALFSGNGGTFTLYRPGQPPLQAPSVPVVYQILKSVGHSTMALAEVVGPYLTSPEDQSWRSPILAFRSRMQSALDGLDAVSMPADWRENNRTILKRNVDFIDACVAERAISAAMLEKFGRQQAPF